MRVYVNVSMSVYVSSVCVHLLCVHVYTCSYNISPHSRRVHSPHSNLAYSSTLTPTYSSTLTPAYSSTLTPTYSSTPTPAYSSPPTPAYSSTLTPAYSSLLQPTPVPSLQPTPEEEHDFKTSGYSCGISSKIMTSLHCTHSQYYTSCLREISVAMVVRGPNNFRPSDLFPNSLAVQRSKGHPTSILSRHLPVYQHC